MFVNEVRALEVSGLQPMNVEIDEHDLADRVITEQPRVYRFHLYSMLMDSPALSYITRMKSHNSHEPCPKCRVQGVTCPLTVKRS